MDKKFILYHVMKVSQVFVEEFLDSLPAKDTQKITWVLKYIQEHKTIPAKFFKKLSGSDEIRDVRIEFGSNIFRILSSNPVS